MGKMTWPRLRKLLIFDWLWSTLCQLIAHGSWAVFDMMYVMFIVVFLAVTVAWPAYVSHVYKLVDRDMAAMQERRRARAVVEAPPACKRVDWLAIASMELAVYGITKFHLDSPYKPGLTELPPRRSDGEPLRPFPPLDDELASCPDQAYPSTAELLSVSPAVFGARPPSQARMYLRFLGDEDAMCRHEQRWPSEVHEYLVSKGVGFWHQETCMRVYDNAYVETLTMGREQPVTGDILEEL